MGVLVSLPCAAWCSLKAHLQPPGRMRCPVEYRWKYIQLLLGKIHVPTGTVLLTKKIWLTFWKKNQLFLLKVTPEMKGKRAEKGVYAICVWQFSEEGMGFKFKFFVLLSMYLVTNLKKSLKCSFNNIYKENIIFFQMQTKIL